MRHLLCGQTIQIDPDDEALLLVNSWTIQRSRGKTIFFTNKPYRALHRVIAQAQKGEMIDFKNQNSLDLRKENLRRVTRSDVMQKRKHVKGFKGVQDLHEYRAYIAKDDKVYNLGSFKTAIEAAKAYDKKALELYGPYARLNFKQND